MLLHRVILLVLCKCRLNEAVALAGGRVHHRNMRGALGRLVAKPLVSDALLKLYPELATGDGDLGNKPSLSLRHSANSTNSAQCGIVWFYHVPKCAGSSLGTWLQNLKSLGYLDDVIPLINLNSEPINYSFFHAQNIEPFLDNPEGKLMAVHHHHRGPGLYGSSAPPFAEMKHRLEVHGCKLIRFAFIRDPVKRLISYLYYNHDEPSMSHSERVTKFREVLEQAPDDENGEVDNGEIRYILNNKVGVAFPKINNEAYSAVLDIARDFEYFGTVDTLSFGAEKVTALAGLPTTAATVPRVNVYPHPDPSTDLPDDIHIMIQNRVTMDMQLYQEISAWH